MDLLALIDAAERLVPDEPGWLLAASTTADQIASLVLSDPTYLEAVRATVRAAAAFEGCDAIVGASPAADEIVKSLDAGACAPTRVLLFDLVGVTGAAFDSAASTMSNLEVVPAALVNAGCRSRAGVLPRSVGLGDLVCR